VETLRADEEAAAEPVKEPSPLACASTWETVGNPCTSGLLSVPPVAGKDSSAQKTEEQSLKRQRRTNMLPSFAAHPRPVLTLLTEGALNNPNRLYT
jgi:hypothetical protein